MSFLHLPIDICISIIHHLNVYDLTQLRGTCKKLLFACDQDTVWRHRIYRFLPCDPYLLRHYALRDVYRATYEFLHLRVDCAEVLTTYIGAVHELDVAITECITQHAGDLEQLETSDLCDSDNRLVIEFIDLIPPYPVHISNPSYILPAVTICAYPDIQPGHWENGYWIDGRVKGMILNISCIRKDTCRVVPQLESAESGGIASLLTFIRMLINNNYCLSPQLVESIEWETHDWILANRHLCIEY